jgi:peptidoglycan/LPS O-acetylase OafA/YrhL
VYWSLLVEARFYVVALALYWAVPGMRFSYALALFTVVNILCRAVLARVLPGPNVIYSAALAPDFVPWFAAGLSSMISGNVELECGML